MAGRGPAPADDRRRANEPERGEWQPTPGVGWQHGELPPCPARGASAVETWTTWLTAWFAAHWTPADLPNLRLAIKLWARADGGKATGAERSELRHLMDDLGITRSGQQDRRWKPPEAVHPAPARAAASPYGQLRAVK
jgi:hypothetical protein